MRIGARPFRFCGREHKLFPDIKVKEISMHASSPGPTVDKGKSKDQLQAEEEAKADTVSKPGGFNNHPDNPRNPNEVRERHLKKIKQ